MGRIKNEFYKPYWFMCLVRVLLVFVPQTGYIHPDEYFQNVEILASNIKALDLKYQQVIPLFVGKIFEYDASLPWEFNVTAPVRSLGISYFTVGTSYKLLKAIAIFVKALFGFNVVSVYSLLITPRLFLCLSSFSIDFFIYKICVSNSEKYKSRLLILATSYVILVYASRPFTNTIELILFAALLYFVSDSLIFANIIVRQKEYLNKRYESSDNPADRAKLHKLRLCLSSFSFHNVGWVSTVVVCGFFNRPTFLLYALFPVFFWLYRGIGYKSVGALDFYYRILALLVTGVPALLFLIIFDSFFYGYISWGELGMLDVSINSFVFPALNFIKYNMNDENLAVHGLHPKYFHFFINVPLLFNVLGVIAIFNSLDLLRKLLKAKYHLLPSVRSIKCLMTTSFLAPIIFLSVFPHQEPRFLLPILVPLIYLYSDKIHHETRISNPLLKFWLIINAICLMYYGFIQQGGVYPAVARLSEEIKSKPHYDHHIITNHMYSIPHVFFMQPHTEKVFYLKSTTFQLARSVFTYETGSEDVLVLLRRIKRINDLAQKKNRRFKMHLLLTATLENELFVTLETKEFQELNVKHKNSFYPHFSGEAPPDFSELWHLISAATVKNLESQAIWSCLNELMDSLSLRMYDVDTVNDFE